MQPVTTNPSSLVPSQPEPVSFFQTGPSDVIYCVAYLLAKYQLPSLLKLVSTCKRLSQLFGPQSRFWTQVYKINISSVPSTIPRPPRTVYYQCFRFFRVLCATLQDPGNYLSLERRYRVGNDRGLSSNLFRNGMLTLVNHNMDHVLATCLELYGSNFVDFPVFGFALMLSDVTLVKLLFPMFREEALDVHEFWQNVDRYLNNSIWRMSTVDYLRTQLLLDKEVLAADYDEYAKVLDNAYHLANVDIVQLVNPDFTEYLADVNISRVLRVDNLRIAEYYFQTVVNKSIYSFENYVMALSVGALKVAKAIQQRLVGFGYTISKQDLVYEKWSIIHEPNYYYDFITQLVKPGNLGRATSIVNIVKELKRAFGASNGYIIRRYHTYLYRCAVQHIPFQLLFDLLVTIIKGMTTFKIGTKLEDINVDRIHNGLAFMRLVLGIQFVGDPKHKQFLTHLFSRIGADVTKYPLVPRLYLLYVYHHHVNNLRCSKDKFLFFYQKTRQLEVKHMPMVEPQTVEKEMLEDFSHQGTSVTMLVARNDVAADPFLDKAVLQLPRVETYRVAIRHTHSKAINEDVKYGLVAKDKVKFSQAFVAKPGEVHSIKMNSPTVVVDTGLTDGTYLTGITN